MPAIIFSRPPQRTRAFAQNQLLKVVREARRVVILALAEQSGAVVVRRVRMQERRQWHIEQLVERRQARQSRRSQRRAVIALLRAMIFDTIGVTRHFHRRRRVIQNTYPLPTTGLPFGCGRRLQR